MWRPAQLFATYFVVSLVMAAQQMPNRLMAIVYFFGTALALLGSLCLSLYGMRVTPDN